MSNLSRDQIRKKELKKRQMKKLKFENESRIRAKEFASKFFDSMELLKDPPKEVEKSNG